MQITNLTQHQQTSSPAEAQRNSSATSRRPGVKVELHVPADLPSAPQPIGNPRTSRLSSYSHDPEEVTTLHWSHDVECAFIALLWHHPDYLILARRELDFSVHISIPAYRKILEAICIVHGEIGEADWNCVLHCIREMGVLEEVGGIEGLSDAYTDRSHCYEGYRNPEVFFNEYIRLLKAYARVREVDPFKTVRRYTGHGLLAKNKFTSRPGDPSAIGRLRCPCCGQALQLRGWRNGSEIKLKAESERS
jgi:hypothetical protein